MGEHLIGGEFQSDKYPWCERGFVPLKLTDPMAQKVLWEYARVRGSIDAEFAEDLREALRLKGYDHEAPVELTDAMLLLMYERWSEEMMASGFLSPDEWSVQQFRKWLCSERIGPTDDYERKFLAEYRRQQGR